MKTVSTKDSLMALLLLGTAFAYFVGIMITVLGQIVWEGFVMWIVKSGVDKGKSLTALRYLIRDLVRFHKLEVTKVASLGKRPYRIANSKMLRHMKRV
jgi:hypothetical protein